MKELELYLIKRSDNYSYDEYIGAVVAAASETKAKYIHPSGHHKWDNKLRGWINTEKDYNGNCYNKVDTWSAWVLPSQVTTKFIGITTEKAGVILAANTGS